MRAPVLLIIFNRPDTTARVLAEIVKANPPKLFVFGDGPREDRPDDIEKCAAARAVVERVEKSDCEVVTSYSRTNLGCGRGPAEGINWVFQHTDRAIIIEDDCVPHPSFFRFCDEMLERYRDDRRIMHVAGYTFQCDAHKTPYSYFFSCHNFCAGGWATWRRAWQYHDLGLALWPELRNTGWLEQIVEHPRAVDLWRDKFDHAHAYRGTTDYWDYQWTFACWAHSGLSILPTATLLSNIGFGHPDATHTTGTGNDLLAQLAVNPTEGLGFPLRHPSYMARDVQADRFFVHRALVPSLLASKGLVPKLRQKLSSFITEHPSLTSPKVFARRLFERSLLR